MSINCNFSVRKQCVSDAVIRTDCDLKQIYDVVVVLISALDQE